MSVTESQRHELFEAAKAVFGPANAETFMNLQPTIDEELLATKSDLLALRADVLALKVDIAELESRLLRTLGTWFLAGQSIIIGVIAAFGIWG